MTFSSSEDVQSGEVDEEPDRTSARMAAPRISYVLARLDRVVRKCIGDCVEPHGLSVPLYTAMSVLGRRSGLSNAQLARRTYVSPQAMSQLLEQLDQAGLVVREPHATHGRIRTTRLTDHGKSVLAQCDAAVDRMEATMLHGLDSEQSMALTQTLVGCVRALGGGFESAE